MPITLQRNDAMAGVGLAAELVERFLDLVGEIEQELRLPLDVGQRTFQLGRW